MFTFGPVDEPLIVSTGVLPQRRLAAKRSSVRPGVCSSSNHRPRSRLSIPVANRAFCALDQALRPATFLHRCLRRALVQKGARPVGCFCKKHVCFCSVQTPCLLAKVIKSHCMTRMELQFGLSNAIASASNHQSMDQRRKIIDRACYPMT
jgi:hypothetical protein